LAQVLQVALVVLDYFLSFFFPLGGIFSKLPSLLPISGAGKYGGFGWGGSCGLFTFFMVGKFMSKKKYYK
jgi:hypothetical protein